MKNLKKIGKVLSTKEQKNVNGGRPVCGLTLCEVCGLTFPNYQRCGNRCNQWIQPC